MEHFDAKGEADHLFTELGVPTTFLLTSFTMKTSFTSEWGPKKVRTVKSAITFPMADKKLPLIAVEDIGKSALAIFKKGKQFIGKTIGIAGEHLTGAQMAAALTKALGQEVRYNEVSPDEYRKFGFPGAEDMGNVFQFKRDFQRILWPRHPSIARGLNPRCKTLTRGWP